MLKNVLLFVTGAAMGSVVTWKIVEKKYKALADEEIASVKDSFGKRKPTTIKTTKEESEKLSELDTGGKIVDYSKIVNKERYNNGEESENENEEDYTVDLEEEDEERHEPTLIAPEEFGTIDHFGTKTLTYYMDDVLTDEVGDIINNRDDIIGSDALDHFGEYEDDAVHIRDIDNEMDYEILKSDKLFSGIARSDE